MRVEPFPQGECIPVLIRGYRARSHRLHAFRWSTTGTDYVRCMEGLRERGIDDEYLAPVSLIRPVPPVDFGSRRRNGAVWCAPMGQHGPRNSTAL